MSYEYLRKIRFAETDAAGIMHFTNILRLVEEAEHNMLAEHEVDVIGPMGGWPKVHVEADYVSPLYFGDMANVTLLKMSVGNKSLRYEFKVSCEGELKTKGVVVLARVGISGESITVPERERTSLEDG